MTELAFLPAHEIAALIRNRRIGCTEALDHFIARVERHNPAINAIVVRDFDRARERARAADRTQGAAAGPLHGVPMTVKESFAVAGLPTTLGLAAYRDNIARRNAVPVERLLAMGANVFGKTNVPPWIADGQSDNPVYGRTNNPWDLARTPGGSSGGASAAVAAGLTGIEIGSDIASSIRNPAHFCGLFGHKPTFGLVPVGGQSLVEDAPDCDILVIGPLARSADDLEIMLEGIAGPDEPERAAYRLELPKPARRALKDFRVAMVLDDPRFPVDREVQAQLSALAGFLTKAGATVRDARPAIDSGEIFRMFIALVRATTSGRQTDAEFAAAAQRAKGMDFGQTDVVVQTMRGNTLSQRDWNALNHRRHQLRRVWNAFFADYDVLLCPPFPVAAHPHDPTPIAERTITINNSEHAYGNQLFWAGYGGVFYLPATVAPIGLTSAGLPCGVQIMGPQYADLTCIHFARLLEREYRRFAPPPGWT